MTPPDVGAGPLSKVVADSSSLKDVIYEALVPPTYDRDLKVGMLGCGWVAGLELDSYQQSGIEVVAMCDRTEAKAALLAEQFFPRAMVFTDVDEFLSWDGYQIADVATHVDGRPELVDVALSAGKHVLSQKPFVEDLRVGEQLDNAAIAAARILAVNQNGRWAPHFAAMLAMTNAGLIGEVVSADFRVAWPHDLAVKDMPVFAEMTDLILYDFGAHWFDLLGLLAPVGNLEIFASTGQRPGQAIAADTQAQALVTGPQFAASLIFRAAERHQDFGGFAISGTKGIITHQGRSLGGDIVRLVCDDGVAELLISDNWFVHGMRGSMVELLRAVTEGDSPSNSAKSAIRGLSLCFAACASAVSGRVVSAGDQLTRSVGTPVFRS